MANSKNLRTMLDRSFDLDMKAYDELVKLVESRGGCVELKARFIRMDGYLLKGEFITAIRRTEYSFSDMLEVLPKYADANDDCAWLIFEGDNEFLDFNLNEVCEAIEEVEDRERRK